APWPLLAVAPCGRPTRGCACGRLPPLVGVTGLPFRLALAAANRPLVGGLGRDLAVGGRPYKGATAPPPRYLRCENAARTGREENRKWWLKL
ncbi:hypothetical protein B296_00012314, partial [Ensete ventricosum]